MNPAEHRVTSLSSFIAFLERAFEGDDGILYRGQEADWELLPRIARIKRKSGDTIGQAELKMLRDFKLQGPALIPRLPVNNWEWLTIAQHYGMATRFLDWTKNPLAALWFAIKSPPKKPLPKKLPRARTGHAVVWAFSYEEELRAGPALKVSPFNLAGTRVYCPRHISTRVTAQSGWFTVHKLVSDARFIPLERQPTFKRLLTKIVIPNVSFSDMRAQLDSCGVNASSMFADLGGMCENIQWTHSLLEDESED
jgi:hypothetical protein